MDLGQFKELFNPLPGNHYLQVTTTVDDTTYALYKLMQDVQGELRLTLYEERPSILPDILSDAKFQSIKNFSAPFRGLPRDNDIVILKDILNIHKNPELLLKIAYTTLANNSNIIIMQKKGTMDIEQVKALLEKLEYRTPNEIDVLKEFDLVIAKKMHMWGNGL